MSKLQEAKSKLFASRAYLGPRRYITIEGVELEIRAPKAKHMFKGFDKPGQKMNMSVNTDVRDLILTCVYLKETGEQFFTEEDLNALAQSSFHAGGIIPQLLEEIGKVSDEVYSQDVGEVAKN